MTRKSRAEYRKLQHEWRLETERSFKRKVENKIIAWFSKRSMRFKWLGARAAYKLYCLMSRLSGHMGSWNYLICNLEIAAHIGELVINHGHRLEKLIRFDQDDEDFYYVTQCLEKGEIWHTCVGWCEPIKPLLYQTKHGQYMYQSVLDSFECDWDNPKTQAKIIKHKERERKFYKKLYDKSLFR